MYFDTGCDAVELNVLKDILGEPANDEFAAELDTQTKTSGKLIVFTYITFVLFFLEIRMVASFCLGCMADELSCL